MTYPKKPMEQTEILMKFAQTYHERLICEADRQARTYHERLIREANSQAPKEKAPPKLKIMKDSD